MIKDVVAEMRTDRKKYSVGEEVRMSITVTNMGRDAVELVFASAQRYDFAVVKNGEEVWRWSSGKMFAMVLESLHLRAGESQTYTEAWKLTDAVRGVYRVIGMITSRPSFKAACTFEVVYE